MKKEKIESSVNSEKTINSENNGIKKVTEKSKKFAELLEKVNLINEKSLSDKTTANRTIWRNEVLKNFKTEKTARRLLRNKQTELSKQVIKFFKISDANNLKIASENLEKFYIDNIVNRNKFTNISNEKDKGQIIQFASEISLNL